MLFNSSNLTRVPKTSLKVEIKLQHGFGSLKVLQTFSNTSENPLEVTFSLPIDPNLVLTSLRAHLEDGSVVECRVKEKEKAMENFQDSLSSGHHPVLGTLDEENLEICIGKLLPGQNVLVETGFVLSLSFSENCWKFEMPDGFFYSPSDDCQVDLLICSEVPLIEWKSNWEFDFSLEGQSVRGLYASSIKGFNTETLFVSFRSPESLSPCILAQYNGECYATALSFVPDCLPGSDIHEYEQVGEFLFLIDRSGSMSGTRIELAKLSLCLFLKSLNSQSKFNIISFGSDHSFLHPNSVQASSAYVSKAISKVSIFSADMGGTNIFTPLSQVYRTEPEAGYPRFIFLLTDGDVGSLEEVLQLISANHDKGKVYTFGIEEANQKLIREAAKCGNGDSFYIKNSFDIGKNVIKALNNCISPFISQFEVNWNCEFAPKLDKLKSVPFGSRFSVFALASHLPDSGCVFTCFDSLINQQRSFEIREKKSIPGDEIFKLWANQKNLEDPENSLEVSLKYQIVSGKTAYFGLKTNSDGVIEEVLPVRITSKKNEFQPQVLNNSLPSSSESSDDEDLEILKNRPLNDEESLDEISEEERKAFEAQRKQKKKEKNYKKKQIDQVLVNLSANTSFNLRFSLMKLKLNVWKFKNKHLDLVFRQESEGFWIWDQILDVGLVNQEIEDVLYEYDDERVVATCLAIAFLNKFCLDFKDEWVLIERKAVKWMKKEFPGYQDLVSRLGNELGL